MISVLGERIETKQIFTADSDFVLKALRVKLISFGNPAFTEITCKIFKVRGDTVLDEICSSQNTIKKIEIPGDSLTEVYFDFQEVIFKSASKFAIGFIAAGYVHSDESHLAVMKGWPEQIYASGIDSAGDAPLYIGFIGRTA